MKFSLMKIPYILIFSLLSITSVQAEELEEVIVVLNKSSLLTTKKVEQTLAQRKKVRQSEERQLRAADLQSERRSIVNTSAKQNKQFAFDVAKQYSIEVEFVYGNALLGFAGKVTKAQKQLLLQDQRVRYISKNLPMNAQKNSMVGTHKTSRAITNEQITPWGIKRLNGENAANTGAGIHVFVVDSGIDVDHPDLQAAIVGGKALVDCSGECSAPWDDDYEHGTHVAGIIAAQNNSQGIVGVAPGVSLHAVKVLDNNNNGSTARIAAGIDYVTQETLILGAATIANVSIGGAGDAQGVCSSEGYSAGTGSVNDAYYESFCNATNAGVIISAAAGNFGVDGSSFLPTQFDDTVIAVSAAWGGDDALAAMNDIIANNGGVRPAWMPLGNDNGDWWWDCSNYGDQNAAWANHASAPIAYGAPGYNVLSTLPNNQYGELTGTSMAAPHSSGAIALYLTANIQDANYSAFTNIRSAILSDATSSSHFNNSSNVSDTGCGIAIRPHHEPYLSLAVVKDVLTSTSRPITDAGEDQSVDENTQVLLSGTVTDDDAISQVQWQQLSGTTVVLENASSENANFTSPEVSSSEVLTFMLVGTDDNSATGSDIVKITVNNAVANELPIADAGSDQSVEEALTVTLNGSNSRDNDGTIASYLWQQTSGVSVALTAENTANANFTSPNVASDSVLVFSLTVVDDKGDSQSDSVEVTVTNKVVVTPPPKEQPSSGGGSFGLLLFLLAFRGWLQNKY